MVNGATTPLGHAVIDVLLRAPDVEFVLAVGREPGSGRAAHAQLAYQAVDLTRARPLHDLLWGPAREHRIDVVLHDAHHRASRDRGARVHAQNVGATHALVKGCIEHPTIRRVVYRSFAEVYDLRRTTSDLLDEDAPLDFDPAGSQWVRDRVEADLTVCSHLHSPLQIAVLRLAEVMSPGLGSQLWDYLSSRVCLRPLGFDPMLNVLSVGDAVAALVAALRSSEIGVFNIPGADTLPLSGAIAKSRSLDVPVPGPLLAPLYGLRHRITGFDFRYDMNLPRFHFGGVLEGSRARDLLGYTPCEPAQWPRR